MYKSNKILAIIPARGSSRRLPRKLLNRLAGKPLISYTIAAAKSSKYLNRIIVSTENKSIAAVAKKYGAEVINRPIQLAQDDTSIHQVVIHNLNVLQNDGYAPDIIVLLLPIAPLCLSEDIENAIEIFIKNRNKCESVVSVCKFHPSPFWSLKRVGKYIKPFLGKKYVFKQSQDLSSLYVHNGAIFVSTPKVIQKYKNFYSNKMIPYIMPLERSIDVDEEIDFLFAEFLIKNKAEI